MLDYDGTLSPIARTPAEADMLPGTEEVLERLSELPQTMVAVISGRALGDLTRRVGCDAVILYGNHGLECRGLPKELPIPMEELVDRAIRLNNALMASLGDIDGILIENKGVSVSVHYRQADPRRTIEILGKVRRIVRDHEGFRTVKGRRVVELRPDLPVDKGTAVRELMSEVKRRRGCEPTSLYAGDDTTDEDAFAAVSHGVTILVGEERASKASHRVRSPAEMARFLEALLAAREERSRTGKS